MPVRKVCAYSPAFRQPQFAKAHSLWWKALHFMSSIHIFLSLSQLLTSNLQISLILITYNKYKYKCTCIILLIHLWWEDEHISGSLNYSTFHQQPNIIFYYCIICRSSLHSNTSWSFMQKQPYVSKCWYPMIKHENVFKIRIWHDKYNIYSFVFKIMDSVWQGYWMHNVKGYVRKYIAPFNVNASTINSLQHGIIKRSHHILSVRMKIHCLAKVNTN